VIAHHRIRPYKFGNRDSAEKVFGLGDVILIRFGGGESSSSVEIVDVGDRGEFASGSSNFLFKVLYHSCSSSRSFCIWAAWLFAVFARPTKLRVILPCISARVRQASQCRRNTTFSALRRANASSLDTGEEGLVGSGSVGVGCSRYNFRMGGVTCTRSCGGMSDESTERMVNGRLQLGHGCWVANGLTVCTIPATHWWQKT